MKATLSFTLPEESQEYEDAYHGTKYRGLTDEFGYWLYNGKDLEMMELGKKEYALLEYIRKKWSDLREDWFD